MINQNKNQRIYLFYIFCHQENACPHQPHFLQFPLHLMLLDFHWLKNSKDLWNALIQSFESREHINVKVYPHFEFKFIMQHVHTFHAYLVQSLLRNAVWMLWSLCDFKCNANLTKSRYYESLCLTKTLDRTGNTYAGLHRPMHLFTFFNFDNQLFVLTNQKKCAKQKYLATWLHL